MEELVARASLIINAPRKTVWAVLLLSDTVMKIMPVSNVIAPWRSGERFTWAFDLQGKRALVEGIVHRIEDGSLLEYEYGDPHTRDVLHRENVHQVLIRLTDEGAATRVSVTQDANRSRAAQAHAEGGWRMALNHLKGLVERG